MGLLATKFSSMQYTRIGSFNSSLRDDPKDPGNEFVARCLVLMEARNCLFERVGVFTGPGDVFDEPRISEWRTLTVIKNGVLTITLLSS